MSIVPSTHSMDLNSWFPLFIPIDTPLYDLAISLMICWDFSFVVTWKQEMQFDSISGEERIPNEYGMNGLFDRPL